MSLLALIFGLFAGAMIGRWLANRSRLTCKLCNPGPCKHDQGYRYFRDPLHRDYRVGMPNVFCGFCNARLSWKDHDRAYRNRR